MRRFPVGWTIAVFVAVAAIAGFFIFYPGEHARYAGVQKRLAQTSDIQTRLTINYTSGNITSEEYRMEDKNGTSTATYRVASSGGKIYTITAPPSQTYTVSFFFEKIVQDGVWNLVNRTGFGDTSKQYTVYVYQNVQGEHGSRTVQFTDPHYLATTAGHQFHIHLQKGKPVPNLLTMSSTALADPHYEKVVNDFRQFGPASFRRKVAQVRAQAAANR